MDMGEGESSSWELTECACISSTLTAKSFAELVRYIFKLPDVTAFLSKWLCQDPIEGCQHQKSSTHDHRDVDRSFWSMSHQHYEQLQRTAQGELSEQQAADTWH